MPIIKYTFTFTTLLLALLILAPDLATAHCGLCGVGDDQAEKDHKHHDHDQNQAQLDEPAPDFELSAVTTGQTHHLTDYSGKIVVLTFQSINCPWDRMRDEAGYQRYLSPLAKEYADQNVQFLAINANKNESAQEVKAYAEQHEIPYPILKDPGNKVADLYDAKTTPHIFIIDSHGTLRYQGGVEKVPPSPENCGRMDTQYLKPVLDALISGEELPYRRTSSKGCTIKRKNI